MSWLLLRRRRGRRRGSIIIIISCGRCRRPRRSWGEVGRKPSRQLPLTTQSPHIVLIRRSGQSSSTAIISRNIVLVDQRRVTRAPRSRGRRSLSGRLPKGRRRHRRRRRKRGVDAQQGDALRELGVIARKHSGPAALPKALSPPSRPSSPSWTSSCSRRSSPTPTTPFTSSRRRTCTTGRASATS